ncbi:response regulator transcription factor [Kytococcus sedentarius]|uniref:Response regulator with CheY-like receiver domain and winged-helix DNA-binding domain n=1 Tax=Kytococcus sedentarius (strain ATCC 14392 / DSM 20547 / JCM 11482 / CCUG 33030 / NBRC 15357 / NCTC 11040 / CCM 314 / 541) TaxID=478801 RepID=C7NLF3_KYTSD|nr:response regulator transcription factor [Kytococcus sedentarius]ACV07149.1 response regulator with CheY-like receiver domain and winged-helix DNA-binding domain [Kytococcus sedentarius DSM 20547]QQB63135.1 response regulator transcription factor [Kytococcus sedentarius]STX14019.1 Probable transcriptional regulatory protein TcrX [Kytococcus sedentarius]
MDTSADATLLVVEDEPNIRELLATSLRFAGFEVHTAAQGSTALQLAAEVEPDLLVLDVMLPDMDGFTITRRLRERDQHMPVLFLTARDSVDDKVKGLTVGGDDYVTKPFSLEEVVARIRAILRRSHAEDQADEDRVLTFEDLTLNEDTYEVSRAGRVIEVSPTEFNLLRYLMQNPHRVLSKAQILDHVWDYDFRGEMGIVESYISYLRRKIDTEGLPPLIHTKRGVGYVLRLPPESVA